MDKPFFGMNMPIPKVDTDTREFWQACRERRLVIQQCRQCRSFRFAPSPICHECQSFDYENVESKGIGTVFTWTVTHRLLHPAAKAALPYNVVAVKLDDCGGATITSNLIGVPNDRIFAGMQVRVHWEKINEEITLPRFAPVSAASDQLS